MRILKSLKKFKLVENINIYELAPALPKAQGLFLSL